MFTLKLIGLKSSSGANESQMAELREELEEARGWKTKVRIWNVHRVHQTTIRILHHVI